MRRGRGPTVAASATAAASTTPGGPRLAEGVPVTATPVDPPAGSTTDLAKKPVITGSDAKAPTEVQVADIVEGNGAEATTLARSR